MINDYIIIQSTILVLIYLIYNNSDITNTVIIGIIYLILNSFILFIEDSDILTSFLLIIDLNVFFILLSVSINFIKFLYNNYNINISFKYFYKYLLLLIFFIFYIVFFNYNIDYNFNKIIEISWLFYINLYNFYSIKYSILNSDLHILREVYFNFNNLEFFIITIFIYFSIITVYGVVFFLIKTLNYYKNFELYINFNFYKNKSTYFYKFQDSIKQINTKSNLKIWYNLNK